MRSLALTLLFGSVVASGLLAQSLTEHAAAAAGATIGTAAGKPLGTALNKVFGEVNQASPAAAKPTPARPVAAAPAETGERAPAALPVSGGGGGGEAAARGTGGASSRRSARRRALPVRFEPLPAAPITSIVVEPMVKELSAQDVAGVKVGASAGELRAALGAPESKVSIPDDDGHLVEICQYWSKGEPVGTVRLDNGRVVSVQVVN